ncbi:hypothetical protein ETD86_29515 [Nonomuraea turkmeniaca]|uniref:Uncharacterized protein n=1 Tax=Nonomuraea turkmeniaca TaxID=103838 RepID=A0A5S4FA44_9ACTN|nr:hypothetical protein [Nonomuraea turkmeniaca]TMR14086.1 hypothetical protein ETD86_29515 [Nonomuraea turkmeniaca]
MNRLIGDNVDNFHWLVVAEAVMPSVPPNVTAWLHQRDILPAWLEALITYEGRHQVAWWTRRLDLGDDAPETETTRQTSKALRDRLEQVRRLLDAGTNLPRARPAQAVALRRLRESHAEEYGEIVTRLRREHELEETEPLPRPVQRLLNMPDTAFSELVADDVSDRADAEGLDHYAVNQRWKATLRELGNTALVALGQPPLPCNAHTASYRVADRALPLVVSPAERDVITRRMLFLTFLRVRMQEAIHIGQIRRRRYNELVAFPADEYLLRKYFVEYARYRLGCDEPVGAASS